MITQQVRRLLLRVTGKPTWPGWGYVWQKSIKYAFRVPPTYLRAKYREVTNYQPKLRESHAFLFICGVHRSGTSITHRLLCENPNVSGMADTTVQEDEGQHLQTVYTPDSEYGLLFALQDESHLTEDSPLVSEENRNKLLREWGRYLNFSRRYLIEKSPSNITRSRFLQALLPNTHFVFVVRHPIAVALASQKWTDEPLPRIIEHWTRVHELMLSDLPKVNSKIIVRYEDLCRDPDWCISKILNVLELTQPIRRAQLADTNQNYFERWEKSRVDTATLDAIQKNAGPIMIDFGYSLNPPYVAEVRSPTLLWRRHGDA